MPADFIKYVQPTDSTRNDLVVPVEAKSMIDTSKAINTDWFAANVSPSITGRPTQFRIVIRCATTTVVRLEMDDGATVNITMNLNDTVALTGGSVFTFDINLLDGQSFNIQHATTTQAIFCSVIEMSKFT